MTELIRAAAQREAEQFAAKMKAHSLEIAVDVWLKRVAGHALTATQRSRLIKAVGRGKAPETKDIQLTHAALLRLTGLGYQEAGAAAVEAGATYTEVAAVLGISQQAASKQIAAHRRAAQPN
ncbi:Fis family transcriptional regulator [Mycolicibacterium fortuitum]